MTVRPLVAAVAGVLLLASCSEGDPGADGDVESLGALVPAPLAEELTVSGRCDDGTVWATDDAGSVAVVVAAPVPAGDEVDLPSDEVDVTVLHGDDLSDELCAGDRAAGSPAVRGRLALERDDRGCLARFRVDGLEAEDGTTFGPVEGDVAPAGCEPG